MSSVTLNARALLTVRGMSKGGRGALRVKGKGRALHPSAMCHANLVFEAWRGWRHVPAGQWSSNDLWRWPWPFVMADRTVEPHRLFCQGRAEINGSSIMTAGVSSGGWKGMKV